MGGLERKITFKGKEDQKIICLLFYFFGQINISTISQGFYCYQANLEFPIPKEVWGIKDNLVFLLVGRHI